jgi:hypothetical protein
MDSGDDNGTMAFWPNATKAGNESAAGLPSGGLGVSLNFVDSFVKALSVMIVSELGDKTFFLAGMRMAFFYGDQCCQMVYFQTKNPSFGKI